MSKIKKTVIFFLIIIVTTILLFIPVGIGYYYISTKQMFIGVFALSACLLWYISMEKE